MIEFKSRRYSFQTTCIEIPTLFIAIYLGRYCIMLINSSLVSMNHFVDMQINSSCLINQDKYIRYRNLNDLYMECKSLVYIRMNRSSISIPAGIYMVYIIPSHSPTRKIIYTHLKFFFFFFIEAQSFKVHGIHILL